MIGSVKISINRANIRIFQYFCTNKNTF
jgi:hypothetical protein